MWISLEKFYQFDGTYQYSTGCGKRDQCGRNTFDARFKYPIILLFPFLIFVVPDGQLFINPYYALGLYHIPLLVTTDDLSEDLHQYENIIHLLNMNVREVKGRRGLGSYPVWVC